MNCVKQSFTTVITQHKLSDTFIKIFEVLYLLLHSLNQQALQQFSLNDTNFIKTTQSHSTTTNQLPFFRHRNRVITERHAVVD